LSRGGAATTLFCHDLTSPMDCRRAGCGFSVSGNDSRVQLRCHQQQNLRRRWLPGHLRRPGYFNRASRRHLQGAHLKSNEPMKVATGSTSRVCASRFRGKRLEEIEEGAGQVVPPLCIPRKGGIQLARRRAANRLCVGLRQWWRKGHKVFVRKAGCRGTRQ
jgi:hypothetical protein